MQQIADRQYLSSINASPNVVEFYDMMTAKLKQFGTEIKTEVGSILAYEVTKVGDADANVRFILDMRNDYGGQSGLCFIGENVEKMTPDQRQCMYTESRAGGSAKGFDPNGDV